MMKGECLNLHEAIPFTEMGLGMITMQVKLVPLTLELYSLFLYITAADCCIFGPLPCAKLKLILVVTPATMILQHWLTKLSIWVPGLQWV
jgi:hypothetical protein